MTIPMTPPPGNPHRAAVSGFEGQEFTVKFTPGATLRYLREDGTWAIPPGGGGGSVWGGITGTLSDQTDLQNALNLKANISSLAPVATTGVYNDLTGKPTLGTVAALSYPGGTSTFLRADGTWAAAGGGSAAWGSITGTLSSQTDLQNALNLKANLASPTFTGAPLAPTATLDTSTTQLATTAFVMGQAFAGTPAMNGTAAPGSSTRWARGDHVHPSDTTKVTNPMTTAGDILVATSGGAPARLGIGSNGQVLTVSGGVLAWGAGGGGGSGDVVGPASSVNLRVAVFSGTTGKLIADGGTLLSALAPLVSPAFSGAPTAPTAVAGTNTTQIATTAFVQAAGYAPLASPVFTGTPAAPTASASMANNIANTEYVQRNLGGPNVPFSSNKTLIINEVNSNQYHPPGDTANRTITIPTNAAVGFAQGAEVTFINDDDNAVIITPDSGVTLRQAGTGASGARTLAQYGVAVIKKVDTNVWYINGVGLT